VTGRRADHHQWRRKCRDQEDVALFHPLWFGVTPAASQGVGEIDTGIMERQFAETLFVPAQPNALRGLGTD